MPAAQQLDSSSDNRSAALWAYHRWNADWLESTTRLSTSIPDIGTHPPGMALPRTAWVRLNPPPHWCRTFPLMLTKCGMAPFAAYKCDAEKKKSIKAESLMKRLPSKLTFSKLPENVTVTRVTGSFQIPKKIAVAGKIAQNESLLKHACWVQLLQFVLQI